MEAGVSTRESVALFRDPVNGLTHFVGSLLACMGLIFLIQEASDPLRPWHLATYSIFGTSMVLLYTTSTLFHWLPITEEETSRLRKLDHIMIFIFIASTYTPFCLIPFRGPFGVSVCVCIWIMAFLGSLYKLFWINTSRRVCIIVYVCVGWFALIGTGPVLQTLQPGAIFWLLTGGFFYSTGAIVYATQKPDPFPLVFGHHEIFHILVMLGSGAHFWVIYRYVSVFE
ncbi:MAG: PAQR family membrane homeostasis protein TrhA [Desulfomonilia bacterium]